MTPLQLLEKLEILGLDDKVLGKIRDQIEDPSKSVKATAVLKYLVKKGQITESQARNILKKASDTKKKSTPTEPVETKHNTEDLTSNFAPEPNQLPAVINAGQTRLDLEDDIVEPDVDVVEPVIDAVPITNEPLAPIELESAAVIDEAVFDYGGDANAGFDNYDTTSYAASGAAADQAPKSFSGKKDKKNQWLSKWPYIAFFLIALLLIFGLTLVMSVFNADPEARFKAAKKHFDDNSYQAAEKGFREYIEDHPSHKYINIAKARRVQCVMAATFATKNWEETIRNGETLLPKLADEEDNDLSLIRDDVALMLSKSLDQHSTKLLDIKQLPKMEEGLQVAKGYKKLIDNPEFISSSQRKSPTIKRYLDNIDNNLQTVTGSIQKEKDYSKTLASIKTLGQSGETESAFKEYQSLTRNYGDLGARKELRTVMLEVSKKERELVVPIDAQLVVSNSEAPAVIENTLVLYSTTGESVDGLRGEVLPFLVDGAVYGFDAGTGAVVWRKFIGFQSNFQPQMLDEGESLLVSDMNTKQLIKLKLKTGELIWRTEIGDSFLAPSIAGQEIVITTETGKLMQIDSQTGNAINSVKLPQVMSVSALVAERDPYIYQPGDYSNIYVLSKTDLSCKEVYYLGHYKGTIAVPPFSYNGLLIVITNGGDHANMNVFRPAESGLELELKQVMRVTNGPITMPLQRLGRWLMAISDSGEMQILEFNQNDENTPIGKVANGNFDNGDGEQAFVTTQGSNLWVAGKGAMRYKIQRNLGQFQFVDIKNHADYFVCPAKKLDEKMFYVRRRAGSGMISASLTDAISLEPIWRTDFGGKLGSEVKRTPNGVLAISNQGDLFSIDATALQKKYLASSARASDVVETLKFHDSLQISESEFAYVGPAGSKDFLVVDGKNVSSKLQQLLPPSDKPACLSIVMSGDLIVANTSGQVARVNAQTGSMVGEAFLPPVQPSEKVNWLRPVPVNETNFAIASQGSAASPSSFYLLNIDNQRAVRSSGELQSGGSYLGELATDGRRVWVVERTATNDSLIRMDLESGTPVAGANVELPGAHVAGPWVVGTDIYIHLDSDQLLCLDENMAIKWKKNLANDRLACPPLDLGGDLVLLFESGKMLTINSNDGSDTKTVNLGQPLANRPVVVGQKMFFSGFDGTIHIVDLGALRNGSPNPRP